MTARSHTRTARNIKKRNKTRTFKAQARLSGAHPGRPTPKHHRHPDLTTPQSKVPALNNG